MLYDVFRAYGDALSVATLQGVTRPVEHRHDDAPQIRTRSRLSRLIASWAERAWHRSQPELIGCG